MSSRKRRVGWAIGACRLDGAGGVVSTVDDMLLWAKNLLRPRIASAEIFARMSRDRPYHDGASSIYGLGMTVMAHRGLRSFGHHGQLPGVFAEIAVFPEIDTAIILIANTSALNPFALGRQIADELLEDRLRPVVPTCSPPAAGIYRDSASDAVIEIRETSPADRALATAMVEVPIERHAPDRFRPFWPMNHLDLASAPDGALVGHDGPVPIRFEPLARHPPSQAEIARAMGRFLQPDLKCEWIVERSGSELEFQISGRSASRYSRCAV